MLRLRSNWMVMAVVPCDEVDVIEEMPAMVDNWRSMVPATEAAMVSALAPGNVAVTLMVGKSTRGSADDRQQAEAEDAERDDRRRDQRRHDRPADTEFGERHRSGSRPCLAARLDPRAVRQQQLPVVDDALVARQALRDHRCPVEGALDLDRLHLGDAVLDHEHEVAGLAALHGRRRHDDRILAPQRQLGR